MQSHPFGTANAPVIIPTELVQALGKSESELKIDLAVFFYEEFHLSSGQAARFAAIPRVAFMYELKKRKIALHYDEADAQHDVEAIQQFNEKFPPEAV